MLGRYSGGDRCGESGGILAKRQQTYSKIAEVLVEDIRIDNEKPSPASMAIITSARTIACAVGIRVKIPSSTLSGIVATNVMIIRYNTVRHE